MSVVGLDHVQLAMPRGGEDQARRFYGGVLGLEEVEKPPVLAARGGCWFEGPGTVVRLGIEEDFRPARKAHPAFVVKDLERLRTKLREHGAPLTEDDSAPEGVQRCYTADPFGNRVELVRDGDGFSQRSAIARRRR